jgi:hypothetical protein
MRLIRLIFSLLIIAWFLSSCLETYYPEFSDEEVNTLVISGGITDQEGYHSIYVSLATNVSQPEYFPVTGCWGYVADDKGNNFNLQSLGEGHYQVWIGKENLVPGRKYKLVVVTPLGSVYESDEEVMPDSPEIDSMYYSWEFKETNVPGIQSAGLQFYADFAGGNDQSHYYRWIVEETWEYHSPYIIEWYYDGKSKAILQFNPPDYSKQVCYKTQDLEKIFTMKTSNLEANEYKGFPLHFIDNTSEKLLYKYSVLIRQMALSERAYQYWDYLRQNDEDQDGLYQKQPMQIQGNIYALGDFDSSRIDTSVSEIDTLTNRPRSNKRVLGYFSVSSLRTKRTTLTNLNNLNVDLSDYCLPWVPKNGLSTFLRTTPYNEIVYLVHNDTGTFLADKSCFDCRLRGGTTSKPAFLP